MSKSSVVIGKSGTGKTFVAAHLAMALGYLGQRTLLVGCDQKQDARRALSAEARPSLMEAVERAGFDYEQVHLDEVTAAVNAYVDVMELGPSQLIVGHYGSVLDEAFHLFTVRRLLEQYDQIVLDVSEERFDSAFAPLFRWVESAVAVSDDSAESLFVLNRLLRASLIGYYEFKFPLRIVGVVHNRTRQEHAFRRYIERTQCFPLMTIPEEEGLGHLRHFHKTLFGLKKPSREQDRMITDFVKVADLLRANPLNLVPLSPLPDEEVWQLEPPVTFPN